MGKPRSYDQIPMVAPSENGSIPQSRTHPDQTTVAGKDRAQVKPRCPPPSVTHLPLEDSRLASIRRGRVGHQLQGEHLLLLGAERREDAVRRGR